VAGRTARARRRLSGPPSGRPTNSSSSPVCASGKGPPRMKRLLVIALVVSLAGCGKEATYKNKTVSEWRQDLRDASPQVRREAAQALAEIGVKAKAAVPDLGEALGDSDDQVRVQASLALWSIGPKAKESVPQLIAALKDSNVAVRLNAAGALGGIEG